MTLTFFRGLVREWRLAGALSLVATVAAVEAAADPFIAPGDMALRHDIQRLADAGVITGPTTTWPLAWGPIAAEIRSYDADRSLPGDVRDAMRRVMQRATWEMRSDEFMFRAGVAIAEEPTRIRSFESTPRESGEAFGGAAYTGDWFTVSVNAQVMDSPTDDKELRADGSVIGAVIGNYSVTANTLERWWGPGWDGSLILSNNARPIPALSLDRNFTTPFRSPWLSWLGPWDLALHFGRLESDRAVPEAQFFGLRFNFRPIRSLEIGLSRTAQWCGEGRPCNLETFTDLLLGNDNIGDDNINESNEPGNQLAGVDVRWATRALGIPLAVYGQFIGEDEAGGLPSRYLGQIGVEGSGYWRDLWSYRWFAEFAATNCRFYEQDEFNNCAYNNGIYQSGYRYRGRVIGHGLDSDARVVSAGLVLVNAEQTQWNAVLRFGDLNRGDTPDPLNSLTAVQQDLFSLDLTHKRSLRYGVLSAGIGIESVQDVTAASSDEDVRGFLRWETSY